MNWMWPFFLIIPMYVFMIWQPLLGDKSKGTLAERIAKLEVKVDK